MRYDAVIFDFNGVILWDAEWQEQAWNEFAAQVRGRPFTPTELERYMHGRPVEDTMAYLLGRRVGSREAARLTHKKELHYQRIALKHAQFGLSPGAEKLFDLLVSNKIKINIATSSPPIMVPFYYKHLPLARWFPRKRIVYDNGSFRGKPQPDIYLKAAKKIGVDVRRCIVIEDAVAGVESARRAHAGKIIGLVRKSNSVAFRKLRLPKLVRSLREVNLEDLN